MSDCMDALYRFAHPAVYWGRSQARYPCRVFVDTGWLDEIRGFESQAAQLTTLMFVQLKDIEVPQKGDRIFMNNAFYSVMAIQAQDDLMVALQVRKDDDNP